MYERLLLEFIVYLFYSTLVIGSLAVNSAHAASNIDVGNNGNEENTQNGPEGSVSITADTGNVDINAATTATIDSGTTTTVTGGTGTTVTATTGTATLNAAAGAANVTGGTGTTVTATTGTATIEALAGATNVTATTTASMTVPSAGGVNGVVVGVANTTITGGTGSTTLTLDDNGAIFSESTTGAPVRVTGVADGVNPFDAVNFRQLQAIDDKIEDVAVDAFSGVATVAALAAIPEPVLGKRVSLGVGYGNYKGESAVAAGFKAYLAKNVSMTAGAGASHSNITANAGIGISLW